MDPRTKEKRACLELALEKGPAMLHLDARRPGVLVPAQFREDFQLRLNVSWRFDPPDLSINDWGVRETLSFSRTPYKVAVPWSAIYAITGVVPSVQAWLFPEDMPQDLIEAAARRWGLTGEEVEQLKQEASKTPALGIASQPSEDPAEPAPRPRGFVPRIVKVSDDPAGGPEVETAPAAPEAERAQDDAPAPVAPEGGLRRGHLRLVK